ncbi:MAG: FAD-dependent oxidoreductase [Syntrophomonadaceae bacterium]
MQATQISEGVFSVGVLDPDLRIFDIIMTTDFGTSYNAYLVKGRDKTALIDTVKAKFFDEYLADLQKLFDLKEISYLIVNHTEPDHAGSVEKMVKLIPGLTVLGSNTALNFLKEITNTKFKQQALQNGDVLDLGGKTLHFINAPFLHWPDSIYTYLAEDQLLFSCDSFGSHFAEPKLFNDLMDQDILPAFEYYFDKIMGPFKPYVVEALDKIQDLPLKMICPGHGPILRDNPDYYIGLYRQWAAPAAPDPDPWPKIVMPYLSVYGYTKMIAEGIIDGLQMAADFNIKQYDLVKTDLAEVLAEIETADALLIGSPTLVGDTLPPVWDLLSHLSPVTHGHLAAAAFGAYGWSGEAVPNIESRLRMLRMEVMPGLRINFKPSERNLEDAFRFGMDFAKLILQKKAPQSQRKWRCLVCGHIYEGEEPPDVCPACGVVRENFVAEKMEDEFLSDSEERFLIVGGGIAALSAGAAIRRRNRTGKITLLTEEEVMPYYRPVLPDLIGSDLSGEKFYVYGDEWYQRKQIEVRTSSRVIQLDTGSRQVTLEDGSVLDYDKLILATGARSSIPGIPGADKAGVLTLRDLADARLMKQSLKEGRRAVLVVAGVQGLQLVDSLVNNGLQVTVIESRSRLMPNQLDEPGSERLRHLMLENGVEVCLGVEVASILGGQQVSGVQLSDGQVFETDLVVFTGGYVPNVELAQAAGIQVDGGIQVDRSMRTSTSDVFAAGDAAILDGKRIGSWAVALEMGRVAGANAAGDWLEYSQPVIPILLKVFGQEVFSLGEVNLPPGDCRITEVWDKKVNYYQKSFVKDGVLVGVIIMAPKVDTRESMQSLGRDASGVKRSNKWKCRVCGYVHEGLEPPDECPACGADKDMFDPVS